MKLTHLVHRLGPYISGKNPEPGVAEEFRAETDAIGGPAPESGLTGETKLSKKELRGRAFRDGKEDAESGMYDQWTFSTGTTPPYLVALRNQRDEILSETPWPASRDPPLSRPGDDDVRGGGAADSVLDVPYSAELASAQAKRRAPARQAAKAKGRTTAAVRAADKVQDREAKPTARWEARDAAVTEFFASCAARYRHGVALTLGDPAVSESVGEPR